MPTGAGLAPAGIAPCGYGTPDAATIPGGAIFRNTLTGEVLACKKLDPATRDYEFDAYGRNTGMTSAAQCVTLALNTELGSSAVRTLGHELGKVQVIGANFTRLVDETLRRALADGVTLGLIDIVSTHVVKKATGLPGAVAIVRWRDRTTNQEHNTNFS